jgi:MSHA biogenesis protein MshQ
MPSETKSAGGGESRSGIGTIAWVNPGNIGASDDSRATSTLTLLDPFSTYLVATSFGFQVLGAQTIDGISMNIERSQTVIVGQAVSDNQVRVVKTGVIGATEKAVSVVWSTADTISIYGNSTDLWSDTWTPTNIRHGGFGAAIAAAKGGITDQAAQVDNIQITIYYTLTSLLAQNSWTGAPSLMLVG